MNLLCSCGKIHKTKKDVGFTGNVKKASKKAKQKKPKQKLRKTKKILNFLYKSSF